MKLKHLFEEVMTEATSFQGLLDFYQGGSNELIIVYKSKQAINIMPIFAFSKDDSYQYAGVLYSFSATDGKADYNELLNHFKSNGLLKKELVTDIKCKYLQYRDADVYETSSNKLLPENKLVCYLGQYNSDKGYTYLNIDGNLQLKGTGVQLTGFKKGFFGGTKVDSSKTTFKLTSNLSAINNLNFRLTK